MPWRPIGLMGTLATLQFFEKVVRVTASNKACLTLQCLLVGGMELVCLGLLHSLVLSSRRMSYT